MTDCSTVEHLPVLFPEKEIFYRLGGNVAKTVLPEKIRAEYRRTALQAFELCRPCGRWLVATAQVRPDGVMLDDGFFVAGRDFAARCAGATRIWCAAVTVGSEVLSARDRQERVALAAVYDAVAGECADAAMDMLQKQCMTALRRNGWTLAVRRYSPGYGDMPLSVQRYFYDRLKLDELGISLNTNNFLIPEKSVTAFAGVTEEL